MLSMEEKKALEDHYKNRDLYDPSKEPGQEPPSFAPAMCSGGEMGYAEGGPVMLADGGDVPEIDLGDPMPFQPGDFSGPVMSADTDTAKAPISAPPAGPAFQMPVLPPNRAPQPALRARPAAPVARGGVLAPPPASLPPQSEPGANAATPSNMSREEFSQLLQYLQPGAGTRIGQGAMSGLAGLADAIESGVARGPGTGFQKNIEESRQKQKENLLNALKAKYETGYKGQELALGQNRLHEEQRQHDLEAAQRKDSLRFEQGREAREAGQHGEQLGFEKNKLESEENKTALEQAAKTGGIWNKLKGTVGLGVPGPNPAILERAQGKTAAPAPLTATNKATGHKIVSTDGGKTWKEAK